MFKLIWWFSMSIVATIALVVGLSVADCCSFDLPTFQELKELVTPAPPPPNYYEEFLTILKKMEDPNPDPNKKEDCPESKQSSPTENSLSSLTADCRELRTMVPNEDEIKQAVQDVDDFKNAEPKESLAVSVSLIFVSPSEVSYSTTSTPSTPKEWAKKNLALSETAKFQDIVDEREKMRGIFATTFPKVAENSKGLGDICNGVHDQDPYWSLACTVVKQAEQVKADKKLQQREWKTLPFFSYNDVLRVKYLLGVVDKAIKLKVIKVIEDNPDAPVLEKLCLLDKEKENIQLGIIYEMNEANKGDADVKKMTEAVLKFVGEVKTIIANCR